MPDRRAPQRTADLVRSRHGPAPVRVATLLAEGLTEGRLRAAVQAGVLVRVRHGVLALAPSVGHSPSNLSRRAKAALAGLGTEALVGDAYAAALHRLPSPRPNEKLPNGVSVLVPGSGWRSGATVARRAAVAAEDRAVVCGVPCSSLERTALDCARGRPLAESLVLLDAALRARILVAAATSPLAAADLVVDPSRVATARSQLVGAYRRLAPVRHGSSLRSALELADPRAETALESASRGLLLQGSLPVPDLQVWVHGDDGRWYRADMGWREARVLGEADGRVKYTDPQVLWDEKRRQDAILAAGTWRALVRWTADDVWRTPSRFLDRVRRALGC